MKYFFSLFFLILFHVVSAQDITGPWHGSLDVQGKKLPLIFTIVAKGQNFFTRMQSPAQGPGSIPADSTMFVNNELTIKAKNLGVVYKAQFKADKFEGVFTQNGMSFPLILSGKEDTVRVLARPQEPKLPFNYQIEEVLVENKTDSVTLAGTLTTPKSKKNFPVVILITGSGPQNRDAEMFDHKPFWLIADDFAKKGIGVLRLDDRGVGRSSAVLDHTTATTKDFAGDISAAVDFLAQRGYKNIGLAGHSEGGMIAPMVAVKNKNVQFMVLLAAPGVDILDLMRLQSREVSRAVGKNEAEIEKAVQMNYVLNKTLLSIDSSKPLKEIYETELKKIPVLSFTEEEQALLYRSVAIFSINEWYKYFIAYKPSTMLEKIKIPVLAINGNKDTQVPAKENLAAIASALKKAGNKSFKTIEMPGLNHLFQHAKTGSHLEYGFIEETISPEVLNILSDWILQVGE